MTRATCLLPIGVSVREQIWAPTPSPRSPAGNMGEAGRGGVAQPPDATELPRLATRLIVIARMPVPNR